jgi:hypothetical protein
VSSERLQKSQGGAMTELQVTLREKKYVNTAPSPIRIAMSDEEDDLFDLCRELHRENGYLFSFSEERVRKNLQRAFNRNLAMIPVIGPKGRIEAAGYVSIEQFQWSDDWHISEWFNYVRPAFRKSQHAKELLKWEKGQADNLKLVLFIGVVSATRLAAKLRLYRRMFGGGTPLQANGQPIPIPPPGFDIDTFLLSCGCAGGYFVYRPPVLYSDTK